MSGCLYATWHLFPDGRDELRLLGEPGISGSWLIRHCMINSIGEKLETTVTSKGPQTFGELKRQVIEPEINAAFEQTGKITDLTISDVVQADFQVFLLRKFSTKKGNTTHKRKRK